MDRALTLSTLMEAQRELDRLAEAGSLTTEASWTWPQTLVHCAQSIEYSMAGFPSQKSALFQRTLGSAAFAVFTWRGRMSHNLAEPIPGAASLATSTDATAAVARLRQAIAGFQAHTGPLRPHFAYGELTRAQYEQAHAMHLANHFSGFDVQA